ncbi:MAG: C25 family cysteine peptidase [Anaerolineales bacterium]
MNKIVRLAIFAVLLALTACQSAPPAPPQATATVAPVIIPAARPDTPLMLHVSTPGIYSLSAADLRTAGWQNVDFSTLQLLWMERTIPLWIAGEGDAARLWFYAPPLENFYTDLQVFVLSVSDAPPQRVVSRPAPPPGELAQTFTARVRAEQNTRYESLVVEGDHWFWEKLSAPRSAEFTVATTNFAGGAAQLRIETWGSTGTPRFQTPEVPDHQWVIAVNGKTIGTEKWNGKDWHTIEITLPEGILTDGVNTVSFSPVTEGGALADIIYINWVEVDYAQNPQAVEDTLHIAALNGTLTLEGFSAPPQVWDITENFTPTLINLTAEGQLTGESGRTYLAAAPQGWQKPETIRPMMRTPDLRAPLNADYLALGAPELLSVLQPLLDAHQADGLKTIAIPLQAIYDQFGGGMPIPEAIRDFLRYTVQHGQVKPRYVLLLGDFSYDTKGYQSERNPYTLPSMMVQTVHGGQTASDVLLAQLDDDTLPDVAIGRVPARTPAEVQTFVQKNLAYRQQAQADWQQRILAVADGQEPVFSSDAQTFLNAFTAYQTTLYAPPAGAPDAAAQVDAYFDEGNLLVAYFGHGSLTQWGKDKIFTVDEIPALQNAERLPVVVNMTCLTGLFIHPKVTSMAETLLFAPNGGAVAMLAPTSLTVSYEQAFLHQPLVQTLTADMHQPLGDALLYAQRQYPRENNPDVLNTFLLFGDPALRMIGEK